MTMEDKLAKLYGELANILVDPIREPWEKIYYLGRVNYSKDDTKIVVTMFTGYAFYVEESTGKLKKWNQIGRGDKAIEEEVSRRESDAHYLHTEIFECMVNNGHEPWNEMWFTFDRDGNFDIDYKYDVLKWIGDSVVNREAVWAYECFGYRGEPGSFWDSCLREYLDYKAELEGGQS